MVIQTGQDVNSLCREIQESAERMRAATVKLAELLIEARRSRPEADFWNWLEINTVLPANRAREYMTIGTILKEKTK